METIILTQDGIDVFYGFIGGVLLCTFIYVYCKYNKVFSK